jgi:hypothetical protein
MVTGTTRWLRTAAWTILAVAALGLWHGQVRAACEWEAIEAAYFDDPWFEPPQSAPRWDAPPLLVLADTRFRTTGGAGDGAALAAPRLAAPPCGRAPADPVAPLPWRRYCSRSLRLLD